jgi:hypothetical protein
MRYRSLGRRRIRGVALTTCSTQSGDGIARAPTGQPRGGAEGMLSKQAVVEYPGEYYRLPLRAVEVPLEAGEHLHGEGAAGAGLDGHRTAETD